jgi:actin-related protein
LADITPVVESIVLIEAAQTIHVGGKDVEEYLFKLLRDDATLESELGRPLKLEDCRKIKESSACEIFSGAARLGRGNVDQRVPADLDGVTVSLAAV